MDETLRAINSDYDAKRTNNLTLNVPKFHFVREGLFDDWLKSKGKLGGQHKVPRLSNDRAILENILNIDKGMLLDKNPLI